MVDELRRRGHRVELLDGDEIREHLSKGLGFSKEDRDTNIRRIGWVAQLLARNGVVAVTAAISPYRAVRDEIARRDRQLRRGLRRHAPRGVRAARREGPLRQGPRRRDPRVHRGLRPATSRRSTPRCRVVTHDRPIAASVAQVLGYLEDAGLTPPGPAPRPKEAGARA